MIQYIVPTDKHENVPDTFPKDRTIPVIKGDSIFEKYNLTLDHMNIEDDDVIVFSHNDITIRDEQFEAKLEMYFKYKEKIGLAGVIGTNLFLETGGWWFSDRQQHSRGRIIQGDGKGGEYNMTEPMGFDDSEIVAIDGCIMFMRGKVAKEYRFDEKTFSGYHFYDVDSCLSVLEMGWDVGIIDTLVRHESEGRLPDSWHSEKEIFLNKWKNKGYTFPLTKTKVVL